MINYRRILNPNIAHRVIIDSIEYPKEENVNDIIKLTLANETGIFKLQVDALNQTDILVSLCQSVNIPIPLDYKINLNDLINKVLYFKYEIYNYDNFNYEFGIFDNKSCNDNEESEFTSDLDIDGLPF
ncbi:MAG: hypothetical protein ACK5FT_08255 [Sphingomonadales bacterium]